MNRKLIATLSLTTLLSACVNIEAPDNLVSDTIQAGKDVYHSVTGSKPESSASDNLALSYALTGDETLALASARCITELSAKAQQTFNQYTLSVKQVTIVPFNDNGTKMITCALSINK